MLVAISLGRSSSALADLGNLCTARRRYQAVQRFLREKKPRITLAIMRQHSRNGQRRPMPATPSHISTGMMGIGALGVLDVSGMGCSKTTFFLVPDSIASLKLHTLHEMHSMSLNTRSEPMKRSEIIRQVRHLMSFGNSKAEVYSQLSGPGVKDSHLAWAIATQPDPELYEQHKSKVRALAIILVSETLVWLASVIYSLSLPMDARDRTAMCLTALPALMPAMFAWIFFRMDGRRYSNYIVMALMFVLPQLIWGFKANLTSLIFGLTTGVMVPGIFVAPYLSITAGRATLVGLALLQISFVWYLRGCLFPDLGLFGAKRSNGRYQFST